MIKGIIKFLISFEKIKKNLPVIVGVPVIIQNEKGEILLGKRSNKVALYKGFWGLPGGLMNQGETLKDTAIRETKEELNVDIKITKQSKIIYESKKKKGYELQSINIVFYAKIKNGIPEPKDETKEIKWFNKNELQKMDLAYSHKEILKKEGLI